MKRTVFASVSALLLCIAPALGQGDAEVIGRIVEEGKNNSRVWEYLTYLSEDIGPRLTGSTRMMEANAWTRDVFHSLGLKNAQLHKWGELPVRFDRGPSTARMIEPLEREFEFTTRAWSAGTPGAVQGVLLKRPKTMEALDAMRDQLEGAWVLSEPRQRRRGRRGRGRREPPSDAEKAAQELRQKITDELQGAGIAGLIIGSGSDLVHTGAARGWRDLEFDNLPSEVGVYVRRSDYDALNSRLADGEKVEVEIDLQNHFVDGPFGMFNTVAEIPGTQWPEQVIIISGHLDSWDGPGSDGAQDNGTGSAVTLEAARILMAAGAKPKRTIRFCLWSGEEQGILGSRGYVKSLSPEELANISAVFVDDGGTNYEGGLSCIASMEDMLREATAAVNEAFPDMPVKISVRERMPRGGGSDHSSFNRVGVPGFFWAEHGSGGRESKNYRFIHHTQHDTMRYAVREYLVQSATCAAITAYNLAMADTLLPRQEEEPQSESRADRNRDDEPAKPFKVAESPASGTWKLTLAEEEATISIEISDDGRVRGKLSAIFGDGDLEVGTFDAESGAIKFSYESEMGQIKFDAKIKDDEMTGTLSVADRFTRDFTATRVVEEKADAQKSDAQSAAKK